MRLPRRALRLAGGEESWQEFGREATSTPVAAVSAAAGMASKRVRGPYALGLLVRCLFRCTVWKA